MFVILLQYYVITYKKLHTFNCFIGILQITVYSITFKSGCVQKKNKT